MATAPGAVPLRLPCRAGPHGAARRAGAARALGRLGPFAVHRREHEASLRLGEEMRIELPIETERLVIRPLELTDAEDLGEPEEWIREKVDRFRAGRRDEPLGRGRARERSCRRARRPAMGAD